MPSSRTVVLQPGESAAVRRASPRDSSRAPAEDNFFFFHNQLSKDHAEFRNTSEGLKLADTGSSFGTLFNGHFLSPHTEVDVRHDDEVGFIVVKSVRFIEDVLKRHEGPLIPLSEFNDPPVMLRFKVKLAEQDGKLSVGLVSLDEDAQDSFFKESDADVLTINDTENEHDETAYAVVVEEDDEELDDEVEEEDDLEEIIDSESQDNSEEYSFDEEYEYHPHSYDANSDDGCDVFVGDCGSYYNEPTTLCGCYGVGFYNDEELEELDSDYLLSDLSDYDGEVAWNLTAPPKSPPLYKTVLKEVFKASLYVAGTIVALGIYGSQQAQK